MAPSGGVWAPIAMRLLRQAVQKTTNALKQRLAEATRPLNAELEPILVRNTPRQPISRAAAIRQSRNVQTRSFSSQSAFTAGVRRFLSTKVPQIAKYDRAAFPKSAVGTAVSRLATRAPFASTLRPNLTGGTLSRTAGGYSLGGGRLGGARHFSHTPAVSAQVVNNVSQAVRAFWLSGNKAQFAGVSSNGEKRYQSITTLQEDTSRKIRSVSRSAPGSFIDFHIAPTVTALSPLGAGLPYGSTESAAAPNLNTSGFLDVLSVDFSRVLKDLAVTMNDLKRLSTFGDLPITLEDGRLRVRFPGCDAMTVERLCEEVCVQRGIIHEDPDFNVSVGGNMALLFPFAPDATSTQTLSSPGGSLRSQTGHDFEDMEENPWLHSPEGYESLEAASETESMFYAKPSTTHTPTEYAEFEGLEGIYKFLEECDHATRR